MAGEDFPYLSPFPAGFQTVELFYGGGWVDATADLGDDGWTITRGRADESSGLDTSKATLTLDNRSKRYSPRLPSSPNFGLLGRQTPIRLGVKLGQTRVLQDPGAYWSTPDVAALDITGDIDLRVDIDPPSWRPSASCYVGLLKDGAYGLFITPDGYLCLQWWTAAATSVFRTSTVPLPQLVGRMAVRATLDVDNGAGGHTVRFYTAPDLFPTSYTQLGDPVTTAGVTAIFASTGALRSVCTTELGTVAHYGLSVRNGIAGTVVASPNFKGRSEGLTSFTDTFGRAWSVAAGTAPVTAKHYRFWGEVPSWPSRWTKEGAPTLTVPIEASGVMRRLNAGRSPVRSALFRGCSTLGTNLVGYWPIEDGAGARSVAPGVSGLAQGKVVGFPKFAAFDGFTASATAALVQAGRLTFTAKAYSGSTAQQVRFSGRMPAGLPAGAVLVRCRCQGGTIDYFDLLNTGAGALQLKALDADGTVLNSGGIVATSLADLEARYSLEFTKVGADVKASIVFVQQGETAGAFLDSTFTGRTFGRVVSVEINPTGAALTDFAIAHLTIEKAITSVFSLVNQFNSWIGEKADDRIARLAGENGVTVNILGAGGSSAALGVQGVANVLGLLREAAASDSGLLYEPRGSADLEFRSLETLYDQVPAVSIAYTDNLLLPFEPEEDDQATRNFVTVTRADGAAAIDEQVTGPLGSATIGLYDESVTLSLAEDNDAGNQASWRVHLGTVDEARYPTIGVDLAHPTFLGSADLLQQLLDVDLGDLVQVTGLPPWLPPEPVRQLVQGYVEKLTPKHYRLDFTCTPASPYDVLTFDAADRWSDDGAVLASGLTAGATTATITASAGVEWTHADGDFDLDLAGEQVTVTNVTGTAPTFTLTLVRAVNGVSKAQVAGTPVLLYQPAYWAL